MKITRLIALLSPAFAPYGSTAALFRYRIAMQVLLVMTFLPAVLQIAGPFFSPTFRQQPVDPSLILRTILVGAEGLILAAFVFLGFRRLSVWGYCFGLLLALESVIWNTQGAVFPWLSATTPLEYGIAWQLLLIPWGTLAVYLFVLLVIWRSRILFPEVFHSTTVSERVPDQVEQKIQPAVVRSYRKPRGKKDKDATR